MVYQLIGILFKLIKDVFLFLGSAFMAIFHAFRLENLKWVFVLVGGTGLVCLFYWLIWGGGAVLDVTDRSAITCAGQHTSQPMEEVVPLSLNQLSKVALQKALDRIHDQPFDSVGTINELQALISPEARILHETNDGLHEMDPDVFLAIVAHHKPAFIVDSLSLNPDTTLNTLYCHEIYP